MVGQDGVPLAVENGVADLYGRVCPGALSTPHGARERHRVQAGSGYGEFNDAAGLGGGGH